MMFLSALRRRRSPAWLGIFAILTIFIAPVVSQTLVAGDHGANSQDTGASLNATEHHHHHAGQHQPNPLPRQSHGPHPVSMMDHAACGYCVLFSYTPALSAINSLAIVAANYLSDRRLPTFISLIIPVERFASPFPRAPPF